ncbi:MAG: hypothetical protein HYX74_08630 [Acidobacteria bacterium]|nr:hypothetical protein [Acidobacteriota bacterium]
MLRPPTCERFVLPHGEVRSSGDLPLAPHKDVPLEVRRRVLEGQRLWGLQEERRLSDQAAAVRELEVKFRRGRQQLVGKEYDDRFRAFVQQQRRREAKALLPPAGFQMSDQARRRLHERRIKESLDFLRGMGIQPKRLRDHTKRALNSLQKIVSAGAVPPQGVGPAPQSQVPEHVLTGHTNPVTVLAPPYPVFGWWTHQAEQKGTKNWACLYQEKDEDPCHAGNFSFTGFYFGNDPNTGSLGNVSQLEVWDADDWDKAHATYRSLFGFWYKMPQAGKLSIWVTAQPTYSKHNCYLEDEWGWSNSWTTQEQSFFLGLPQTKVPEEQRVVASSWFEDGYTEGYWSVDWYPNKAVSYYFPLKSSAQFQNNEWVWCWVGIQTRVDMWVNDVSGLSGAGFRWNVKQISVGPA